MKTSWREKLRNMACDILAVYLGLRDPRVPRPAKIAVLVAIIYVIIPVDLIPDVVPVFGWLDDLAAMPLAAFVATKLIPFDVLRNLRRRADALITLWGSKAIWIAALVIVVWISLAATGGWLVVRQLRSGGRMAEQAEILLPEPWISPSSPDAP